MKQRPRRLRRTSGLLFNSERCATLRADKPSSVVCSGQVSLFPLYMQTPTCVLLSLPYCFLPFYTLSMGRCQCGGDPPSLTTILERTNHTVML